MKLSWWIKEKSKAAKPVSSKRFPQNQRGYLHDSYHRGYYRMKRMDRLNYTNNLLKKMPSSVINP